MAKEKKTVKKKLRYFYITYQAISTTKQTAGNLWFEVEQYPSYNMMKNTALEKLIKHSSVTFKISDILINNIIEFKSKKDYTDFCRGELLNG